MQVWRILKFASNTSYRFCCTIPYSGHSLLLQIWQHRSHGRISQGLLCQCGTDRGILVNIGLRRLVVLGLLVVREFAHSADAGMHAGRRRS